MVMMVEVLTQRLLMIWNIALAASAGRGGHPSSSMTSRVGPA